MKIETINIMRSFSINLVTSFALLREKSHYSGPPWSGQLGFCKIFLWGEQNPRIDALIHLSILEIMDCKVWPLQKFQCHNTLELSANPVIKFNRIYSFLALLH